jgi:uncharacterized protein YqjF (DUF2071 family)
MKLPVIAGIIRRRILVNFRVDPEVMRAQVPGRLEPKLHGDSAIAGICLIRLEQLRPRRVPSLLGISSENAAHRVAVTWQDVDGVEREGVFIPRRDTGSRLNQLAGGRLFPGEQHLADFAVQSGGDGIDFEMKSKDGKVSVRVRGKVASMLPASSGFATLAAASAFFETGALGYSVTSDPRRLDGITLHTRQWKVEALEVADVYSSYFADEARFPKGSVEFDCALIMRDIAHEWHSAADLFVGEEV